jgi:hypothetical protein
MVWRIVIGRGKLAINGENLAWFLHGRPRDQPD